MAIWWRHLASGAAPFLRRLYIVKAPIEEDLEAIAAMLERRQEAGRPGLSFLPSYFYPILSLSSMFKFLILLPPSPLPSLPLSLPPFHITSLAPDPLHPSLPPSLPPSRTDHKP